MPLRRMGHPVSVSNAPVRLPALSAAPGMEGRNNQSISQSVNQKSTHLCNRTFTGRGGVEAVQNTMPHYQDTRH